MRPLLKALFRSDATLLPDSAAGTLTVRLLHQASRGQDAALAALLKELNETATLFPEPTCAWSTKSSPTTPSPQSLPQPTQNRHLLPQSCQRKTTDVRKSEPPRIPDTPPLLAQDEGPPACRWALVAQEQHPLFVLRHRNIRASAIVELTACPVKLSSRRSTNIPDGGLVAVAQKRGAIGPQ